MQTLKRLIRQRKYPLKELVARLGEHEGTSAVLNAIPSRIISTKKPNNVYLTKDGDIVEVLHAIRCKPPIKSYACRKFIQPKSYHVIQNWLVFMR